VEKWKKGPGCKQATIPKDTFPQLLRLVTVSISSNATTNIKSGFEKCGIVPLNRKKVLDRLPDSPAATGSPGTSTGSALDESFKSLLKSMRYEDEPKTKIRRKKKVDVASGKSVTGRDFTSCILSRVVKCRV